MAFLTWMSNNIIPILAVTACLGTILGLVIRKSVDYKEKKKLLYKKKEELESSPRKFIPQNTAEESFKPMSEQKVSDKSKMDKIMDIINKI